MIAASIDGTRAPLSPARALLLGGVTVGVLDALDAIVFFGMRGASAERVLQSIASGLLGREAFGGGAATAALGLVLHFVIAFCVVAVYHAASRRMPALAARPLVYGPIYGVLVYVVMTFVVVPLSAALTGPFPPPLPVLLNGVLIHIVGVGLPSALSAWAARPAERRTPPPVLAG